MLEQVRAGAVRASSAQLSTVRTAAPVGLTCPNPPPVDAQQHALPLRDEGREQHLHRGEPAVHLQGPSGRGRAGHRVSSVRRIAIGRGVTRPPPLIVSSHRCDDGIVSSHHHDGDDIIIAPHLIISSHLIVVMTSSSHLIASSSPHLVMSSSSW